LAAGSLALMVGSLTNLVYPRAIGLAIDAVSRAGAEDARAKLRSAILVFVAAFALQAVAAGLKTWLFAAASERLVVSLKQRLLATLLNQPIAFFDQRKTGELLNRLGQDCGQIKSASTVLWGNALQLSISVVGSLALLVALSPRLALVSLPALPVIWLLSAKHGQNLREISRAVQDSLAQSGVVAEEALSNMRTVRAFARESHELERYRERMRVFSTLTEKRARHSGLFTTLTIAVGYGALGTMLWQGSTLVLRGELSLGQLTSFLVYAVIIATALPPLSSVYASLATALGASDRVFELLELPHDASRAPTLAGHPSVRATQPVARVSFANVGFRYPTRPEVAVLCDLDLQLNEGDTVALVGRFGAGKSTVASLLTGLYAPSAGRLEIDGVDVRALGRQQLSERVAIVSQDPVLFSASIAENIRYGRLQASEQELQDAAKLSGALAFIEALPEGFATQVGQRGVCLSGGQRQSIAIARALLKNPDILVLDEATSAIDAGSEEALSRALRRLMLGRTTLIIAHRLSTVALARHICVLDNGQIVARGSHDELLLRSELYRELFERQRRDVATTVITAPRPHVVDEAAPRRSA